LEAAPEVSYDEFAGPGTFDQVGRKGGRLLEGEATDGGIGHVEDFLLSDADWSIHYLVVDTKNWWPGKKVLISPRSAQEVDWVGKEVHLDVGRQKVKDSPAYDPATKVNRLYETRFHRHYGEELMYDDTASL
jgi:hypothetical protein